MKLVDFVKKGSYFLPENQRKYFKQPLDILYSDPLEISQIIKKISKDTIVPKIISVGDVATQTLFYNSVKPDLAVIDEKVQRKKIEPSEYLGFEIRNAENPAGSITKEAWSEIQRAIKYDENRIIIKISGEEDLLVFPVILEAPYNSKVLYGQPNEGLVIVTITKEVKNKANMLMLKMVKANEN